jgi:hypothetical protein
MNGKQYLGDAALHDEEVRVIDVQLHAVEHCLHAARLPALLLPACGSIDSRRPCLLLQWTPLPAGRVHDLHWGVPSEWWLRCSS